MNIIPAAMTAWRDERSIEDAIRHHDRAQLAVAASLVFSFAASLLKGAKYAQLATFLDADTLSAGGVIVAGVVAGFGHWATGGALAVAARSGQSADRAGADAAPRPDDADRARPAERGSPDPVQPGGIPLSRQDDQSMRAGG